jgi:HEAT repeats
MNARRKLGMASPRRLLSFFLCNAIAASCFAQQAAPSPPAPSAGKEIEAPIPGDWAPELLYGIWNSENPEASEALYRAAFAAGPDIIPQLEAALADDRTAEFAAQSLAFMGGKQALEILAKLMDDRRELGLRRFFYGALGEIATPEATRVLLGAIANSDAQPDRTITEAAILALTVRSDKALIPGLREAESKVHDPVVRDDVENAIDVISARAQYLSTPEGEKPDFSIERAVRTYFIPALETSPASSAPAKTAKAQAAKQAAQSAASARPPVTVRIDRLTFSPAKTRALASVTFEIPGEVAKYDMVLQKNLGDWTLASVWLGPEYQEPESKKGAP